MEDKIGILGIGYVGLPLAVFFCKKYQYLFQNYFLIINNTQDQLSHNLRRKYDLVFL